MIFSIVIFGSLVGLSAGITLLAMGESIWVALIAYSSVGVGFTILGVLAAIMIDHMRRFSFRREAPEILQLELSRTK
jgi:hypothetical protein